MLRPMFSHASCVILGALVFAMPLSVSVSLATHVAAALGGVLVSLAARNLS